MYKNLAVIIISVFALFQFGCKGENDVLASFNGGQITRADFNKWLDSRRISKSAILKKRSNQKLKLRQIVVDKLAYLEAVKTGYDKTDDTKRLLKYLRDDFISRYYRKKSRKNVSFKEEAVKVKIIKLLIKNYTIKNNKRVKLSGNELQNIIDKKMELAESIIKELENNGNFEQLVKKHSNDSSKKRGGDIGYIAKGMREPEFIKVAFSLNPGKYSKEPLKIRNAIYILKIEDKTVLTKDNINSKITNKKMAEGVKRRLLANSARKFEINLTKAVDVKDMINDADMSNNDNVLFAIGNENFKVENLNSLINFFLKRSSSYGRKPIPLNEQRKKQKSKQIFMQRLLVRDAIKKGINKEPEFQRDWILIKEAFVGGNYKNDIIAKNIAIPEEEIKSEYDKNKDKRYTKRRKKGNKVVNNVIPFNEAKERIHYMLFNKKRSKERRSWEMEILKKNNYKVNESNLQGK